MKNERAPDRSAYARWARIALAHLLDVRPFSSADAHTLVARTFDEIAPLREELEGDGEASLEALDVGCRVWDMLIAYPGPVSLERRRATLEELFGLPIEEQLEHIAALRRWVDAQQAGETP